MSQHVVCQPTTFFRQQKAPPYGYPCMRKQNNTKENTQQQRDQARSCSPCSIVVNVPRFFDFPAIVIWALYPRSPFLHTPRNPVLDLMVFFIMVGVKLCVEEGWPVILFIVSTMVQGKRTPKKIIITPLVSLAQWVEHRRIQWNKKRGTEMWNTHASPVHT